MEAQYEKHRVAAEETILKLPQEYVNWIDENSIGLAEKYPDIQERRVVFVCSVFVAFERTFGRDVFTVDVLKKLPELCSRHGIDLSSNNFWRNNS